MADIYHYSNIPIIKGSDINIITAIIKSKIMYNTMFTFPIKNLLFDIHPVFSDLPPDKY